MRGKGTTASERQLVRDANIRGIWFPWMRCYELWWNLTIVGTLFTVFFEPYQIAFQKETGIFNDGAAVVEFLLTAIFALDILVQFNLAFYDHDVMVYERKEIFKSYCRRMFWVDLVGVVPFETIALAASDELGTDNNKALLFSLLRLLHFVRLYRLKPLSDSLQYNARISLMWFTLIRNLAVAFMLTHFSACIMYFLARLEEFDDETWLGPLVNELSGFERYMYSLYWSIVVRSLSLLSGRNSPSCCVCSS